MAYVPINLQIYNAAFTGALAGMGLSGRIPSDQNSADYVTTMQIVGAFAQQFDTVWGDSSTSDGLEVQGVFMGCSAMFMQRNPVNSLSSLPSIFDSQSKAIKAIIQAAEIYYGSQGITPPPYGSGGGSNLPNVPDDPNIYAIERENDSTLAWVPTTGFTASLTGVTATVEVGASLATVTGTITTNAVPTAITVSWSGVATGSQVVAPTGTSTNFTITGPFTSAVNNTNLTVVAHVTFSDGSIRAPTQAKTWAVKIVYGSIASGTEVPGQALWNTLNGSGNQLHTNKAGSYTFASAVNFDQVFGILASLGAPTITDPSTGVSYPPTAVGAPVNITENTTTQSFQFWTFGASGAALTVNLG